MNKQISKNEKVLWGLIGLSVAFIILGILFLLNAMQDMTDPNNIGFFPAFCAIDNVLAKYIVVILTMSCGIMLFCNVALRFESKKLRNGLTIGMTAFAFILTLPLVYVFIAMFPYAANGTLGPVGKVMALDRIFAGFVAWFGTGALMWVVLVFMLLLSIVFLFEPLLAGICVVKGKLLQLFGKNDQGKFRVVSVVELPILKKQCQIQSEGCNCECCNCADCASVATDVVEE